MVETQYSLPLEPQLKNLLHTPTSSHSSTDVLEF